MTLPTPPLLFLKSLELLRKENERFALVATGQMNQPDGTPLPGFPQMRLGIGSDAVMPQVIHEAFVDDDLFVPTADAVVWLHSDDPQIVHPAWYLALTEPGIQLLGLHKLENVDLTLAEAGVNTGLVFDDLMLKVALLTRGSLIERAIVTVQGTVTFNGQLQFAELQGQATFALDLDVGDMADFESILTDPVRLLDGEFSGELYFEATDVSFDVPGLSLTDSTILFQIQVSSPDGDQRLDVDAMAFKIQTPHLELVGTRFDNLDIHGSYQDDLLDLAGSADVSLPGIFTMVGTTGDETGRTFKLKHGLLEGRQQTIIDVALRRFQLAPAVNFLGLSAHDLAFHFVYEELAGGGNDRWEMSCRAVVCQAWGTVAGRLRRHAGLQLPAAGAFPELQGDFALVLADSGNRGELSYRLDLVTPGTGCRSDRAIEPYQGLLGPLPFTVADTFFELKAGFDNTGGQLDLEWQFEGAGITSTATWLRPVLQVDDLAFTLTAEASTAGDYRTLRLALSNGLTRVTLPTGGIIGDDVDLLSVSVDTAVIELLDTRFETQFRLHLEGIDFGPLNDFVDEADLIIVRQVDSLGQVSRLDVWLEAEVGWSDFRNKLQVPEGFPALPNDGALSVQLSWVDDAILGYTLRLRFAAELEDVDELWAFLPPRFRPEIGSFLFAFEVLYSSGADFQGNQDAVFEGHIAAEMSFRLPPLADLPGTNLIKINNGDEQRWMTAQLYAGVADGQPYMNLGLQNPIAVAICFPGMAQDDAPLQAAITTVNFNVDDEGVTFEMAGNFTLRPMFPPMVPMASHLEKLLSGPAVNVTDLSGTASLTLAFTANQAMFVADCRFSSGDVDVDLFDMIAGLATGRTPGSEYGASSGEIDLDIEVGVGLRRISFQLGSLEETTGAPLAAVDIEMVLRFVGQELGVIFHLSDREFRLGLYQPDLSVGDEQVIEIPLQIPQFPLTGSDVEEPNATLASVELAILTAWTHHIKANLAILEASSPPAFDGRELHERLSALQLAVAEFIVQPPAGGEYDELVTDLVRLNDNIQALSDERPDRRTKQALQHRLAQQFLLHQIVQVRTLVRDDNQVIYDTLVGITVDLMDTATRYVHMDSELRLVMTDVQFVLPFSDPRDIRVEGSAHLDGFPEESFLSVLNGKAMGLGLSADQFYFSFKTGQPVPLPDFGRYQGGSVNISRFTIGYGYTKNSFSVAFAGELILPEQLIADLDTSKQSGVGVRLAEHNAVSFQLDLIPVTLGSINFIMPLIAFDIDLRSPGSLALVSSQTCEPYWDGLELFITDLHHSGLKRIAFSPIYGLLPAPAVEFDGDLTIGDDHNGLTVIADNVLILPGMFMGPSSLVPVPLLADPMSPYFDNLCIKLRVAGFGIKFNLQRPFPSTNPLILFEVIGMLSDPLMEIDPDGPLAQTIRITLTDALITLPPDIRRLFPEAAPGISKPLNMNINLGTFIRIVQQVVQAVQTVADMATDPDETLQETIERLMDDPAAVFDPWSLIPLVPAELRKVHVSGSLAGFSAAAALVLIDAGDSAAIGDAFALRDQPPPAAQEAWSNHGAPPPANERFQPPLPPPVPGGAPPLMRLPSPRVGLRPIIPALNVDHGSQGLSGLPVPSAAEIERLRPQFVSPPVSGGSSFYPQDPGSSLFVDNGAESFFASFSAEDLAALPEPPDGLAGIIMGARVTVADEQSFSFLGMLYQDASFALVSSLHLDDGLHLAVAGIHLRLPLEIDGRLTLAGRHDAHGYAGSLTAQGTADWKILAGANGGTTVARMNIGERRYWINRSQTLVQIAAQFDMPVGELAAGNGIQANYSITAGQTLTIPPRSHTVQQGETLTEIATRIGLEPARLVRSNHLQAQYPLQPGQSIRLRPQRYHVVRPGETLADIASRYNVSIDALARQNNLPYTYPVKNGDRLRIPEQHYIGQRSDTLAGIARRFNVSPQALLTANRALPLHLGLEGQRLLIPERQHTVDRDEKLIDIAALYNIGLAQLAQANDIEITVSLQPRQRLAIPTPTHIVKQGETLQDIARIYRLAEPVLVTLNRLQPVYQLTAGQRLDIPAVTHHVGVGETLEGLAARYGLQLELLAQTNQITAGYSLPADKPSLVIKKPAELELHSNGCFALAGVGFLELLDGVGRLDGGIDVSHTHCLVDGSLHFAPDLFVGDARLLVLSLQASGRIGPGNQFDLRGEGDLWLLGQHFLGVKGQLSWQREAGDDVVRAMLEAELVAEEETWDIAGIPVESASLNLRGLAQFGRDETLIDLEGAIGLSVFGAGIDGRGRFYSRGDDWCLSAEGALSWQGREWLNGRVKICDDLVSIHGRTTFALPLTPPLPPANSNQQPLPGLYFSIEIGGGFDLDANQGLKSCDLEVQWALSLRFPGQDGGDQMMPIAMQGLKVESLSSPKKLINFDKIDFLPFVDLASMQILVPTFDTENPIYVGIKTVDLDDLLAGDGLTVPAILSEEADSADFLTRPELGGIPKGAWSITNPPGPGSIWYRFYLGSYPITLPDIAIPDISTVEPDQVLLEIPRYTGMEPQPLAAVLENLSFELSLTWHDGELGVKMKVPGRTPTIVPFRQMFGLIAPGNNFIPITLPSSGVQ